MGARVSSPKGGYTETRQSRSQSHTPQTTSHGTSTKRKPRVRGK